MSYFPTVYTGLLLCLHSLEQLKLLHLISAPQCTMMPMTTEPLKLHSQLGITLKVVVIHLTSSLWFSNINCLTQTMTLRYTMIHLVGYREARYTQVYKAIAIRT